MSKINYVLRKADVENWTKQTFPFTRTTTSQKD